MSDLNTLIMLFETLVTRYHLEAHLYFEHIIGSLPLWKIRVYKNAPNELHQVVFASNTLLISALQTAIAEINKIVE